MPLKSGKSKETISANIAELLRSWKETGKIGDSKPKNMKEAKAQAAAIAYATARKSESKSKHRKAWVDALEKS